MVVINRLAWLYAQLAAGRSARMSFNTTVNGVTIHCCLAPVSDTAVDNSWLMLAVSGIMQDVAKYSIVDRGHQHSRGGSQVTIRCYARTQPLAGGGQASSVAMAPAGVPGEATTTSEAGGGGEGRGGVAGKQDAVGKTSDEDAVDVELVLREDGSAASPGTEGLRVAGGGAVDVKEEKMAAVRARRLAVDASTVVVKLMRMMVDLRFLDTVFLDAAHSFLATLKPILEFLDGLQIDSDSG